MFVCCECNVSSRGLCDELIIRPEESYRLWCVVVCDLETSRMRRMTRVGSQRHRKKKSYYYLDDLIKEDERDGEYNSFESDQIMQNLIYKE
jgi:hypothetical protein